MEPRLRLSLRSVFMFLLVALSLDSVSAQAQARLDKRETEAEAERTKLKVEKDAAERAASYIRLADIALSYLEESAKTKDKSGVESYVELYRHAVTEARDEMLHSVVVSYKNPKGFKIIETGIRKHLKTMQEIAVTLDPDTRKPIDGVMTVATKIRDEVLNASYKDSN